MKRAIILLRYAIGRFFQDNGLTTAASLSYTTLLALVPLMAVTVAILAAFPAFQNVVSALQDFIFSNFVPASGETIQIYLQQFAEQAGKLTAVGVAFLLLTAVMLLDTIETALNDIWRTHRKRRPLSRFLVYWALLTLGPVLLGVSLAVSSYLVSLPLISDAASSLGLGTKLLRVLPFITTAIAFGLLYSIVPNCNVPWRHALFGGLVAALLFEAAKKAFALYITKVPTYAVIYGALAAVPVFLIWIYISWAIILIGAQLTFALAHYRSAVANTSALSDGERLASSFRLIHHLWQAQERGALMSGSQLLDIEQRLDEERLNELLECMERHSLVHQSASAEWALSRNLDSVTLSELLHAIDVGILPECTEDAAAQQEPLSYAALYRAIGEAKACISQATQISLKQLLLAGRKEK